MRGLKKFWKPLTVILVGIVVLFFVQKYATAGTISVDITGDELNDGNFEVGNAPVTWTASATDSEQEGLLSLEDGGTIVWETSDSSIVDLTTSTSGTQSTATLKPISAGKVTITATYTKTVNTESGNYELTAKSSRTVIVKFKLNDLKIPNAPYEDNWAIQKILSNSTKPVTWTSSNEGVVVAQDDGSGNGILSLKGAGFATVTAKTEDGQSESFPVVVNAKFTESSSIISLSCNDYYTLSTNATNPNNIYYKSGNTSIAKVESDGTAKGVYAGKTFISVYAVDESHPWYQLLPNPARQIPVKVDLQIAYKSKIVAVGDTLDFSVNVDPKIKTNVNWTSSDTSVASVDDNGHITAHKKGMATIYASLVNKEIFGTDEMQTVSEQVSVIDSFAISESEHILNAGDQFELSAIVTDNSATVSWVSSDESVVKVSAQKNDKYKATVSALKKGTATITATQVIDGVSKQATCEISVKEPVANVEITPSEVEIVRGTTYRLTATFTPERPDNMNVTWNSSDPTIVKVDDKGLITGVKGGKASVSVITQDGIKVASCTVNVREPVTSLKLDQNKVTSSMSTKTYQLTYKVTPTGEGVNSDVTWTSSNPSVATVDESGLVTFVSPGKCTIIAKTVDIGVNGNLIDTCDFNINNPVTAVDLDYTMVTLKLGEQFRLTALITPEDATNKKIIWTSSDASVASVNENGMVTSVGSGSATILAKSEDSGATSMCNVTVYQPVTSLTISSESMTVRKGTEFWLNATALPENAMNKSVTWASSDESIATVDENGKVTTLEPGDCVIKATSQDSGVMAKCSLTVTQPITGIYLNTSSNTIMAGEKFVIVPTITPFDADNKNVSFTSSDSSIASVDADGIVTGIHGGRAVIIAKTEERGLIASCLVNVQEYVSSVQITSQPGIINIGSSGQIIASVSTDTATNRSLSWYSTNPDIVSVDQSGRIYGNGLGTATIYANSTDGSGEYDMCSISVIKGASSVSVEPGSVTISEGKTTRVIASVYPEDASYRDVEWSSSDPNVAIVDYSGEITGISAGICKIYATSTDGNNIVGVCRVTVKPTIPATGVVINSKSITMLVGQNRTLTARIKPSKSTEDVYWVSGDTSVVTVSSNGVVTSRGQGSTEIYAISNETGVESSCEVIVLAMNSNNIRLEQYDSYDLDVFGCTQKITWYSSNKRVATVDSSGKVVGRMAGTAVITAKVNGKILHCTVRVTTMR